MNYEQSKDLKPSEFKRLCGVHLETFLVLADFMERPESYCL